MMITAMIANGRIFFDLGFEADGGDVISYASFLSFPNGIIDLPRMLTYACLGRIIQNYLLDSRGFEDAVDV